MLKKRVRMISILERLGSEGVRDGEDMSQQSIASQQGQLGQ